MLQVSGKTSHQQYNVRAVPNLTKRSNGRSHSFHAARACPWTKLLQHGTCFPLLAVALIGAGIARADPDPIHGAPAAFDLEATTNETVFTPAGAVIRQSASQQSSVLLRLDVEAALPVLDRRGPWAQVRFDTVTGWLWTGAEGDRPADTLPVVGSPRSMPEPADKPPSSGAIVASEARVESLVARLGTTRRELRAGPYTLWTDVPDRTRLDRMIMVAQGVDAAFDERYGLAAKPPGREVIVAYTDPSSYLAVANEVEELEGVFSRGHTTGGIAVLAADGPKRHVEAIMIHEITHLVTRRALGGWLPTWIEEGLAENLAYSHVDGKGRIDVDRVGRFPRQRQAVVDQGITWIRERQVGAEAGFEVIRQAYANGVAPTVAQLIEISFDEFVKTDTRDLHYALAAFFVRYLLDGDDGILRNGFHRFLQQIADGNVASAESLLANLGRDWASLQLGFDTYLDTRPR